MRRLFVFGSLCLLLAGLPGAAGIVQSQTPSLLTRWAADVTPDHVLPDYPRPQLVRARWLNLNGAWDYALTGRAASRPEVFDGTILVPFPAESTLSGLNLYLDWGRRLWYRRTFEVPADWSGERVLLHFGAVDWETTVWVNGVELGVHRGGYDPFSFDISGALHAEGPQEVVVAVWDPSDSGLQPHGKQVQFPEGIWYTPSTGIWQTVWLEPVPAAHVGGLRLTPDVDAGLLHLETTIEGAIDAAQVRAVVFDGEQVVAEVTGEAGQPLDLPIPDARLWSPGSPFLYDLRVTLLQGETAVDEVAS